MLKNKKALTIMVVLFSSMFVFSLFTAGLYQHKVSKLENRIGSLESENSQLRDENNKEHLEAIKKEINDKENQTKSGYTIWQKAEKVSNKFVKQSDGKFKKNWGMFLVNEASRHDIDPYIVYELLKVETGGTFDPKLTGPETKYGQAYGMAQFMKNTAPWIAEMGNMPYEDELLFDPYYSIQLSVVYLDFLYDRYGNWDKALTAYHRGIYGMEKYIQENGHAKSWYAKKIQKKAKDHKLVAFAD